MDYGFPKRRRPDFELLPGYRDAARFQAARVPTGMIVPDGSTHQDFSFINYPPVWLAATALGAFPEAALAVNSTRDGQRVVLHYTLAWFDRFLKHSRRRRDEAEARLLAASYPASADASSIGQGTWDPAMQANRPDTIGGESAAAHLSPIARSFLSAGDLEVADLREAVSRSPRRARRPGSRTRPRARRPPAATRRTAG